MSAAVAEDVEAVQPTRKVLVRAGRVLARPLIQLLTGTAAGAGQLDYIGMLRATDPRATAVVGELSIRSAEFRRLWARPDVRESVSGTKTFRVPEVDDWGTYPLPGNPGPVMLVFTAEPGSADADRLRLLTTGR